MSLQHILFNVGNLFVLPFWLLMIFLPNWQITKIIMKSLLTFVPLGLLYLYLYIDVFSPEFLQSLLNPQLAYITRLGRLGRSQPEKSRICYDYSSERKSGKLKLYLLYIKEREEE